MTTKTIDGRALARRIRDKVAEQIKKDHIDAGLAAVLVGDDPASHLYVGLKEKACREAGIRFEKHLLPASALEREVLALIKDLDRRADIDAILVQLPLPKGLDEDRAIAAIDPMKDVDGFHPDSRLEPGIVEAIRLLVKESGAPTEGRRAVALANSGIFARKVVEGLRPLGLAPTEELSEADVVVIAYGKPGWLTADKIKEGAVVIDVGTTRVGGMTVGDADFAGLQGRAAAVTPVPGGVGPMTVAMLLKRTAELAARR